MLRRALSIPSSSTVPGVRTRVISRFSRAGFPVLLLRFSRLFHLVAEGHAEAAAHQFGAVALGRVMGNARHRHPPDRFAPLFPRQGQLQQPGEGNRVLEKALEEVTEPVEQDPLGMLCLEFDVVAALA